VNNEDLKKAYNLIAFGEFYQALEQFEESAEIAANSDKIVIETLKLKKELQKYLSLKAF